MHAEKTIIFLVISYQLLQTYPIQSKSPLMSRRGYAPSSQPRGRGRGRGRGNRIIKQTDGHDSAFDQQSNQRSARQGLKLELLASISRSGGDDGEGDSLKDRATQEQYWKMVQKKLEAHWDEFPSRSEQNPLRLERESNVLLLLRKLREGVLSSRRKDEFSLDVYETSYYLAIVFHSSAQASSAFTHLPELYEALLSSPRTAGNSLHSRTEAFAVISLLFHLGEASPSQMTFYQRLKSLEHMLAPIQIQSAALNWIYSIRACINCHNYTKFDALTCEQRLRSVMATNHYLSGTQATTDTRQRHHARAALLSAVHELRRKLRTGAWTILRSAYREVAFGSDNDTASWLSRSLFLSAVSDAGDIGAEGWMERCEKDGQVAKKEGFQGRWILRR